MGHHAEIDELSDTSSFEYARFVPAPGLWGRPEERTVRSNIARTGKYRVLLSGFGGDEMTGQALDPRVQLADLLRHLELNKLSKQLVEWSLLLKRPAIHLLLDAFLLELPASIRARKTDIAKVEDWVNQEFARRNQLSRRQLDVGEGPWMWAPSARDWFYTLMTLSRAVSSAWPSQDETRYPYLDQTLAEFFTSIPTEQLLRPYDRRSLMRRALSGLFLHKY